MPHRLKLGPLPEDLRALVVMLHGGAVTSRRPVDRHSLAYRRTRAMADRISPKLNAAGIGVGVLRFSVKGWNAHNGAVPPSVADAREALVGLTAEHAGVPIVLIGHSMGARTASRVADEPGVVGMIGLAPWLQDDDPVDALAGKHLVVAHGNKDRITSPKASRRFVERAQPIAASARFIDVTGHGHYMLSGAANWNRIAATESLELLDRVSPSR